MSADLREKAANGLPEGLEVVGGEASFEEQEDGSQALAVPEGAEPGTILTFSLPASVGGEDRQAKAAMLPLQH